MKKLNFLSLLLIANFIFIGCSSDDDICPITQTDEGVVINNIRWATRNVAAPGTFTANPEDAGMFFQWNRRRGWAITGIVTGWDDSTPTGTEWERRNDPCPPGWRVPTSGELNSLIIAANSRLITRYGVSGHLLGSAPNQIFLPAVNVRSDDGSDDDGSAIVVDIGSYWSSTQAPGSGNRDNAQSLLLLSDVQTIIRPAPRMIGMSIRCVAR